ncbi:MAG: hypothetical protein CM1200mP4_5070 [Rhodospirillaceae bacterium]|nr:MAG: hypothetical protein CM1200mP4_5070 [Rhodospirillaceae bacterium]
MPYVPVIRQLIVCLAPLHLVRRQGLEYLPDVRSPLGSRETIRGLAPSNRAQHHQDLWGLRTNLALGLSYDDIRLKFAEEVPINPITESPCPQ